ncbi:TPA: hypothetical protein ACHB2H_001420 [Klebsiella pneumoniae]
MNIETVNELIRSLESAGELSIKETKVMALAKAFKQLAAENVALKSAVTKQIELRSEIKKAGRPPHADFWVQSICEAEDRVSKALNGTPATDRIVAGIKADGVEEFSKTLEGAADICGKSKAWEAQENLLDFAERGFAFAKQLSEGADK